MSIFNIGARADRRNRTQSQAGAGNRRNNTVANNGMPSTIGDMGSMLRARREAMGATLAEAEVATRIRQKFLAALEADEWALLPGEVVGRGFLRNYAAYLGLEPTEILERRRAIIDSRLASALSSTSAGVVLPGVRAVDYRPKDMELRDDPDPIARGEVRMTPFLSILLSLLTLGILAWGITRFGGSLGSIFEGLGLPSQNVTLTNPNQATGQDNQSAGVGSGQVPIIVPVVTLAPIAGVVNDENAASQPVQNLQAQNLPAQNLPAQTLPIQNPTAIPISTSTPEGELSHSVNIDSTPPASSVASGQGSDIILFPTATPGGATFPTPISTPASATFPTAIPTVTSTATEILAQAPADVPTVEQATPTPIITPTPLPTTAPAPSPPQCPDWRTVIATPFNNQVVRGTLQVRGTATHEDFRYYRIEYAFGADATSGFVYFTGGNAPVFQGVLGLLDTTTLPNEAYTIRLVIIDGAGNFPPPCQVTLIFEN